MIDALTKISSSGGDVEYRTSSFSEREPCPTKKSKTGLVWLEHDFDTS